MMRILSFTIIAKDFSRKYRPDNDSWAMNTNPSEEQTGADLIRCIKKKQKNNNTVLGLLLVKIH